MNPPIPETTSAADSSRSGPFVLWPGGLIFSVTCAAVFVLQLWAFAPLVRDYVPGDDDVAVAVASTTVAGAPEVSGWFTDGFHNYFRAYPEWSEPVTDFMRPLANAIYWLSFELFGVHWGDLLVLGYLGHAVAAALSGWIARSIFRLSPLLAFGSASIAALSPAFWTLGQSPYSIPDLIQFPICQTEIFDSLLMLAAFIAFVKRRFFLFCFLTVLALFLKETALSVPIAAFLLPGFWMTEVRWKTIRNALLIAGPFILWLAVRIFVFAHSTPSYVFGSASLTAQLAVFARNTLLWPSGLFVDSLSQLKRAISAHGWNLVADAVINMFLNVCWWIALLVSIYRALRLFGKTGLRQPPPPWVAGLLFALGTLGLVMLVKTASLRYAYFWFALGPPAILAALSLGRARVAALPLIFSLILPQIPHVLQAVSRDSRDSYAIVKQSGSQLMALLGHLPSSTRHVYIVDDMISQNSSPEYLAQLSGFDGTVTLINNVLPVKDCTSSEPPGNRYTLEQKGSLQRLRYQAQACFDKPWEAFTPDRIGAGNVVLRGRDMRYIFPELSFQRRSVLSTPDAYELGDAWEVQVNDSACESTQACVWIGLDAANRRYFVINDAAESSAAPP